MRLHFPKRFALCLLALLGCLRQTGAEDLPLNPFAHKIAYLKDGEVWVVSPGGPVHEQLTATDGQVAGFRFSEDLNFLAYARIIKYVDSPGIWKKPVTEPEIASDLADVREIPRQPVTSVVIMDLVQRKQVREINPPKDNWLILKRWLPEDQLLYIGASGFDVWGHFLYDPRTNVQKKVSDYLGYRLIYGYRQDFDHAGALMVYVDDAGRGETFTQNLHLLNLVTHKNDIVVSKPDIQSPVFSCNKQRVAFVENEFRNEDFQDHLWICDLARASAVKLCTVGIKIKSESGLAWSWDDRYLLLDFQNQAMIVDTQKPDRTWLVDGNDFHWLDNGRVLYCEGKDVYAFSLKDKSKLKLIVKASQPIFLLKRE